MNKEFSMLEELKKIILINETLGNNKDMVFGINDILGHISKLDLIYIFRVDSIESLSVFCNRPEVRDYLNKLHYFLFTMNDVNDYKVKLVDKVMAGFNIELMGFPDLMGTVFQSFPSGISQNNKGFILKILNSNSYILLIILIHQALLAKSAGLI